MTTMQRLLEISLLLLGLVAVATATGECTSAVRAASTDSAGSPTRPPEEHADGKVMRVVSQPVLVFIVFGGMTALYRMQLKRNAAFRLSEERMRTLVDYAPDAIVIIDAQTGRFVDVNPNAIKLFGLERAELLRGGPIDLSPATQGAGRSSRELIEEKIREALEGRTPVFEWSCRSAAGKTLPTEVHLVRLPGGDRQHIRGSILDISERKRMDQMKNEFISTVSHELRTPITSIRGSLGLIAAGVAGPLPPSARSMVDIAHKNCERLVRLVNDMLDIEKMEAGKVTFNLKPTRLMDVIERAVEMNRPFAQGRTIELRVAESVPDALVFGDEDRLIQVLTNLISNAVKVSPRGEEVAILVARRGGMLRTSIQDRGPGIPEEFRSRIFLKFAQAEGRDDSSTRKGTGLGLTIAKALVERMGGRIGFETEIGKGTSFFFDLTEDTLTRKSGHPSRGGEIVHA